jgi:hypothetical protein
VEQVRLKVLDERPTESMYSGRMYRRVTISSVYDQWCEVIRRFVDFAAPK